MICGNILISQSLTLIPPARTLLPYQEAYTEIQSLSGEVNDILTANSQISDSITDLSATSEEVAASSESCTTVFGQSVADLETLNEQLNQIFRIAENLKDVAEQENDMIVSE